MLYGRLAIAVIVLTSQASQYLLCSSALGFAELRSIALRAYTFFYSEFPRSSQ